MDFKSIIKLYEVKILDCNGNVNEAVVSDMGYEDGQEFAGVYSNQFACSADADLLGIEGGLKRLYGSTDAKVFVNILEATGKPLGIELCEEVEIMRNCEEALGYYLVNFLMGFSDVVLERITICKRCRQLN